MKATSEVNDRDTQMLKNGLMGKRQDSIPVGCVPSSSQPYIFQWPPLGVSTNGGIGAVGPQVNSNDHQMCQ